MGRTRKLNPDGSFANTHGGKRHGSARPAEIVKKALLGANKRSRKSLPARGVASGSTGTGSGEAGPSGAGGLASQLEETRLDGEGSLTPEIASTTAADSTAGAEATGLPRSSTTTPSLDPPTPTPTPEAEAGEEAPVPIGGAGLGDAAVDEEDERAGSRMQQLHGSYIDAVCAKVKLEEEALGRPGVYGRKTLWINPPDDCFAASDLKALPTMLDLMRPRILLVLPEYLLSPNQTLRCHLACGGSLIGHGWRDPGARGTSFKVVRDLDPFVVLTKRYQCNQCGRTTTGTAEPVVKQLPPHMYQQVSVYSTSTRSALGQRSSDLHDFLFSRGLSISAMSDLTQHINARDYDRKRLLLLSSRLHLYREGLLAGRHPSDLDSPLPYDDPSAPIYPTSSPAWIRMMLLRRIDNLRAEYDQAISLLPASFISGDASFKIIKKTIDGYLSSCYSILNEYGEIRLQLLTLSKSLEHLREPLARLQATLVARGHEEIQFLTIDNITGELAFFESAIPSLRSDVVHTAPPNLSGLPTAALPSSHTVHDLVDADEIEKGCKALLATKPKLLGFDTEHSTFWNEHGGRVGRGGEAFTGREKTALIQISSETETFLLRVFNLTQLPPSLRRILGDSTIRKAGRSIVTSDFMWIREDFKISPVGELELAKLAKENKILPTASNKSGLDTLTALVLGLHQPKPEKVRLSQWDGPLSQEQLNYAALDSYLSFAIANAIKTGKSFNLPIKDSTSSDTLVSIRVPGQLIKAAGTLLPSPTSFTKKGRRGTYKTPEPPSAAVELGNTPPIVATLKLDAPLRLVRLEHVYVPSFIVPGYTTPLTHAILPFVVAVPEALLVTRPPQDGPAAVVPPDGAQVSAVSGAADAPLDDAAPKEASGSRIEEQMEKEGRKGESEGEEGGSEGRAEDGDPEPVQVFIDIMNDLSPAPQPGDDALPDLDIDDPNPKADPIPSRVLTDIFHVFLKILTRKDHPLSREFTLRLRDAIFVPDPSDKERVIKYLESLPPDKRMTWEQALRQLFDAYRDRPDTTLKADEPSGGLFTKTARQNEKAVLELARCGFMSDPYFEIPSDEPDINPRTGLVRLPRFRCVRGTNPTEGMHEKLKRFLAAFKADPELVDAYLAVFRHSHNCKVGHQN
ncbi:hypothetical protein RQP46_000895 [Phenoliferia psychrophenolica]